MKNPLIEKAEYDSTYYDSLFASKPIENLHEKIPRFKEEFSKKRKVLSAKKACTSVILASFSLFKMTSTLPL